MQVATLWDELHTRQPWVNALKGESGINLDSLSTTNQSTRGLAVLGINTVRSACLLLSSHVMKALYAAQGLPQLVRLVSCSLYTKILGTTRRHSVAMPRAASRLSAKPTLSPRHVLPTSGELQARLAWMQGLGARVRRDNLRSTWVPTGDAMRTLELEHGMFIRFVIGYRCRSAACCGQAVRLFLHAPPRHVASATSCQARHSLLCLASIPPCCV